MYNVKIHQSLPISNSKEITVLKFIDLGLRLAITHNLCYSDSILPNLTFIIMETTRLSTKGQIIIPNLIRAVHHWREGTEFIIEEVQDGILLKPKKPFAPTKLEAGIGCVGYRGKAISIRQMQKKMLSSFRKKWQADN